MRGQNATLVNGFSCLGWLWVLTPSYYPHLPQQASQECFLQGGSCTHCHSSCLSLPAGRLQQAETCQLQGWLLAQFQKPGPPSSPRGSGFLRLLRSSATPWAGRPGTCNRKLTQAHCCSWVCWVIKPVAFLLWFLEKDLGSNPIFFTLGKWWELSEPQSSPVKWGDDSSLRDCHKAVFPSAGNGDTELIRWHIDGALKDRESQAVLLFFFVPSSFSVILVTARRNTCSDLVCDQGLLTLANLPFSKKGFQVQRIIQLELVNTALF